MKKAILYILPILGATVQTRLDANGNRKLDLLAIVVDRSLGNGPVDSPRDFDRCRSAQRAQHDGELVAPQPAQHVTIPEFTQAAARQ